MPRVAPSGKRIPQMDNARFWDQRYRLFPQLGSGQGSRGYAAWYKNQLIKKTIADFRIRTLIDIGCGDLCWLDQEILERCSYTGLDISIAAVERAKVVYPTLRFEVYDVTLVPVALGADLVVSFDVLIHQIDLSVFRLSLSNILAAIGRVGLISYMTPLLPDGTLPAPAGLDLATADSAVLELEAGFCWMMAEDMPSDYPKPKTAFHEPLPTAVAALRPEMEVTVAGRYRHQTVYAIHAVASTSAPSQGGLQHASDEP
jgi:SAM-dependent methyltransferase